MKNTSRQNDRLLAAARARETKMFLPLAWIREHPDGLRSSWPMPRWHVENRIQSCRATLSALFTLCRAVTMP
jgi:hypothetical protein